MILLYFAVKIALPSVFPLGKLLISNSSSIKEFFFPKKFFKCCGGIATIATKHVLFLFVQYVRSQGTEKPKVSCNLCFIHHFNRLCSYILYIYFVTEILNYVTER